MMKLIASTLLLLGAAVTIHGQDALPTPTPTGNCRIVDGRWVCDLPQRLSENRQAVRANRQTLRATEATAAQVGQALLNGEEVIVSETTSRPVYSQVVTYSAPRTYSVQRVFNGPLRSRCGLLCRIRENRQAVRAFRGRR